MTLTYGALDTASTEIYRDVHKGLRAELFDVTRDAGRIDPRSAPEVADLIARIERLIDFLERHARHEDVHIQPLFEQHSPPIADRIRSDHDLFATRTDALSACAGQVADTGAVNRSPLLKRLYLELADFTGIYLGHQDFEERTAEPALAAAIGVEAVLDLNRAIVASLTPDEKAKSWAVMLPAMNVDGRAELMSGIRASAPPQVFEGALGLAASVLSPEDQASLLERLGLA